MTQPKALVAPGYRGTSVLAKPTSRIRAPAWAAAAERHGHELPRIVPALDGHQPDGAGHARIGDSDHRLGRRHGVEGERPGNVLINCGAGGLDVGSLGAPADGTMRVDASERDVGVGDRGGVAA